MSTVAQERNTLVLANAVELATEIAIGVAGEEVSNTVNGQPIPAATLKSSLTATIQRTLVKEQGIEQ